MVDKEAIPTTAEWFALDQVSCNAMWLSKLARALGLPKPEPMTIFTDNINTQLLLSKKASKNSTRWLDMRYFFVKDAAAKGLIQLERVHTKNNAADGFTKALGTEAFPAFTQMLGMV